METSRPQLYEQLRQYCASDAYPFHMPGHKRRAAGPMADFPPPYAVDITEIDGFDNLHHAQGILREAMDWAASVYGAGRTYYLVNGSTCGVLAAICAATERGGTILMARNSHKAAYHAAALNGLNIRYIYPSVMEGWGLQGGLSVKNIEKMLSDEAKPRPQAVFVTSPTYDGVVSDIRGIAQVCRRWGVPLIVDEAHGAHFAFGDAFPAPALEEGADMVIQSLHKTLPAFTQTALLHVREGLADAERLEYYLQVFQSSSPSYVLMAGIERCIAYMADEGRREMDRFAGRLAKLRSRLGAMRHLRLLDRSVVGQADVWDLDTSKIVVSTRQVRPGGFGGAELAEALRKNAQLEMEMWGADYVTAIATLMDTEEGLARLENALLEIDAALEAGEKAAEPVLPAAQAALPIHEAMGRRRRPVKLEEAAGCISAEYVYLYPPGIPLLVPGEILTQEIIDTIRMYRRLRLPVQGMRDATAAVIRVAEDAANGCGY